MEKRSFGQKVGSFLSGDNLFGKITARCWTIIGANIMFVLFCIPVITIGPAAVALYHVMLKTLRTETDGNPITEFWRGFKANFKQALLAWILVAFGAFLAWEDVRFCKYAGGAFEYFLIGVWAVIIAFAVIVLYLMPCMAFFNGNLRALIGNSIYLAVKNPLRTLIYLIITAVPAAVTYLDVRMQPLYAFLWASFLFGAIAMICSLLLIRDLDKAVPRETIEDTEE